MAAGTSFLKSCSDLTHVSPGLFDIPSVKHGSENVRLEVKSHEATRSSSSLSSAMHLSTANRQYNAHCPMSVPNPPCQAFVSMSKHYSFFPYPYQRLARNSHILPARSHHSIATMPKEQATTNVVQPIESKLAALASPPSVGSADAAPTV